MHTCMYKYPIQDDTYAQSEERRLRVVRNTVNVSYKAALFDPLPESPEDEELRTVLTEISENNAKHLIGDKNAWNCTDFQPIQTCCLLCNTKLTSPMRVPGTNGKAYLLTKGKLLSATAQIRKCTNQRCEARHSYCTWNEGKKHRQN